jgi:hypothetical protein
MDQLVENVLQRPAMFEQRLSVHFEVKGTQQLLHIEQGKSPQGTTGPLFCASFSTLTYLRPCRLYRCLC